MFCGGWLLLFVSMVVVTTLQLGSSVVGGEVRERRASSPTWRLSERGVGHLQLAHPGILASFTITQFEGIEGVTGLIVGGVVHAYSSIFDVMPMLTNLTIKATDFRFAQVGFFDHQGVHFDVAGVRPCARLPSSLQARCHDTVTVSSEELPKLPVAATQASWAPLVSFRMSIGAWLAIGAAIIILVGVGCVALWCTCTCCRTFCAKRLTFRHCRTRTMHPRPSQDECPAGQIESLV
jgi:hypothetical protein